jgi:prepilin-type N-terminal cleavage/methylation domain-containing protein
VSRNRGFTLMEVMIALAIGGLVVLTAQRLFAGAGDGARLLTEARDRLDRDANARRWLEAALLSLAVGDSGAGPFEGDSSRVRFTAWQLSPGGWFEPRRIELATTDGRLVASVSPGEPLILSDGVRGVAFDYLLEPGAETHWVRQWLSPVSAPLAVRLRVTRATESVDTLLLLIKERG